MEVTLIRLNQVEEKLQKNIKGFIRAKGASAIPPPIIMWAMLAIDIIKFVKDNLIKNGKVKLPSPLRIGVYIKAGRFIVQLIKRIVKMF